MSCLSGCRFFLPGVVTASFFLRHSSPRKTHLYDPSNQLRTPIASGTRRVFHAPLLTPPPHPPLPPPATPGPSTPPPPPPPSPPLVCCFFAALRTNAFFLFRWCYEFIAVFEEVISLPVCFLLARLTTGTPTDSLADHSPSAIVEVIFATRLVESSAKGRLRKHVLSSLPNQGRKQSAATSLPRDSRRDRTGAAYDEE